MRFKENISSRAYSTHPMDEEELRAAQLLLPALGSVLAVPLQGKNESFPVSLKKNGHFCTPQWCSDNWVYLLISSLLAHNGTGKKTVSRLFLCRCPTGNCRRNLV